MEEFISLLCHIKPGVDFLSEPDLVEQGLLDSLDIVEIIEAISEHYQVELDGDDVDPENFTSALKMWEMIQRKKK